MHLWIAIDLSISWVPFPRDAINFRIYSYVLHERSPCVFYPGLNADKIPISLLICLYSKRGVTWLLRRNGYILVLHATLVVSCLMILIRTNVLWQTRSFVVVSRNQSFVFISFSQKKRYGSLFLLLRKLIERILTYVLKSTPIIWEQHILSMLS